MNIKIDWDLIKKNIAKEIGPTINTIDPAFDIEKCLILYTKILTYQINKSINDDLDGLEKAITDVLYQNYQQELSSEVSIGLFCKNFEPFIKKIYWILDENGCIEEQNKLENNQHYTLIPVLSRLNKVRPIYLDSKNKDVFEIELAHYVSNNPLHKVDKATGKKLYQRLYPSSIEFDKFHDINDETLNNKFQNSLTLQVIKAVILKNEQSHQSPGRSRVENIRNLESTLITELLIVNFFRKELNIAIKKEDFRKKDFHEYINSEVNRLKKQSSKFVSLSLKSLNEQVTDQTKGFIEDILPLNMNRIRILGQGGSGKTTTLEFLLYNDALSWLKNPSSAKIPVIITLANLSTNETVLTAISKKLNTSVEDVEELIEANDLNLYFDGLNEIVENRESKKQKLQEIATLIEEYPNLSITLTDRYEFDSYQNNMFNIPTYVIQKLDPTQINMFVEKYCNYSSEQSNHVLRIINSKQNISELFQRPLILTRAIEIVKTEYDLPEKEGQIIEKFIDILLRREKDEKKDPLLNINAFKLLLSYVANDIYNKFKTNKSLHEYAFNKILVEGAEKYGLEKFNAGYICRIGYELDILLKTEEHFQFYHQSYFEFFCSNYLKYEIQ